MANAIQSFFDKMAIQKLGEMEIRLDEETVNRLIELSKDPSVRTRSELIRAMENDRQLFESVMKNNKIPKLLQDYCDQLRVGAYMPKSDNGKQYSMEIGVRVVDYKNPRCKEFEQKYVEMNKVSIWDVPHGFTLGRFDAPPELNAVIENIVPSHYINLPTDPPIEKDYASTEEMTKALSDNLHQMVSPPSFSSSWIERCDVKINTKDKTMHVQNNFYHEMFHYKDDEQLNACLKVIAETARTNVFPNLFATTIQIDDKMAYIGAAESVFQRTPECQDVGFKLPTYEWEDMDNNKNKYHTVLVVLDTHPDLSSQDQPEDIDKDAKAYMDTMIDRHGHWRSSMGIEDIGGPVHGGDQFYTKLAPEISTDSILKAITDPSQQIKLQRENIEHTEESKENPADLTQILFDDWYENLQEWKNQYNAATTERNVPVTSLTPSIIKENMDQHKPQSIQAKQKQEKALDKARQANEQFKSYKDKIDQKVFDELYRTKIVGNPELLDFINIVKTHEQTRTTEQARAADPQTL